MSTEMKESITTLKTIYSSLQELYQVLDKPRDQLDFVLNGSSPNEKGDTNSPDTGNITLEMLTSKIHLIERRSSEIAKMTAKLVGN